MKQHCNTCKYFEDAGPVSAHLAGIEGICLKDNHNISGALQECDYGAKTSEKPQEIPAQKFIGGENYWYNISVALEGEKIPTDFYYETWIGVSKNDNIYKYAASVLSSVESSKVALDGLCSVNNGKYYIAAYAGGLNGHGDWNDYLIDIATIIRLIPGSYIMELRNDRCDDVWYLLVCFKLNK